jgi:hypothetical protein
MFKNADESEELNILINSIKDNIFELVIMDIIVDFINVKLTYQNDYSI